MSFTSDRGFDRIRYAIESQLGRKMMTSSTLVETVSINYEDFTEGFLTCGTCLCTYDGDERNPKLLPCSHTVCRTCLEAISSQPGVRESGSFRCPICRESINLPRGGVTSLPPSFLVNQLLDLFTRQRREVIPKCSSHVNQELLFCETCDCVFCSQCTGGTHVSMKSDSIDSGREHTVIPFSIAIKRMSEILLYKAHQCIKKLNEAHESVQTEMRKLDQNSEHAFEDINRTFQELINIVDRRRQELLAYAKKMREDKRNVLQEQLNCIEHEKSLVETECNGLQYQVEVRNITKKISELNEKIDSIAILQEPRENCFIRYEHLHNAAVDEIQRAVSEFGSIRTSKTFPSLCTASIGKCSANLKTIAHIETYDYTNARQRCGGDLVTAEVKHSQDGTNVPTKIIDNRDGTYDAIFAPNKGGRYTLLVSVFGRPIKNFPIEFEASSHINPLCIYGCRGTDEHQFVQPVGITINERTNDLYVLDTGNCRVKILSQSDCNNSPFKFNTHITGATCLGQRACTGIALAMDKTSLYVSNWRERNITEITFDGKFIRHFSHQDLVEPTYLTVNSKGQIIVADNGARALFMFHPSGKLYKKISSTGDEKVSGSKRDSTPKFGVIGAVCVGHNDEIVIADSFIHLFNSDGEYTRAIYTEGKQRGQYGGITYDGNGYLLATRMEKAKSFIQIFDYCSGQLKFTIDSSDAKLKRPSALVATKDNHLIVVDLGNDCIKKYRYL